MAQIIEMKTALPIIRKAYEEQRLGAFFTNKCRYVYEDKPDCGCAVGVLLNKESRNIIKNNYLNQKSLTTLLAGNVINMKVEEAQDLWKLQRKHDSWASIIEYGYSITKQLTKENFIRTLNRLENKYLHNS